MYRIIFVLACAVLCGSILGCGEPNLNSGEETNDGDEVQYFIDVYNYDEVKILESNYVTKGESVRIHFQRLGAQEFVETIEYRIYFDETVIENGEIFDVHGATTTNISLDIPQDGNRVVGYIRIALYEIKDGISFEVKNLGLNVVDLESDAFYTIEASQYILAEGDDVEITFRRKRVVPDVVSYKIDGSIGGLLSDEKEIFSGPETTTTIRFSIPQDDDGDNEYILITLHKIEDESSTEIRRGSLYVKDTGIIDCRADMYTKCEMVREVIDYDGSVQYGKNSYVRYRTVERQGNLANRADEDWFKVKLASGLLYEIAIENTTPQELAEGLLEVFLVDGHTNEKLHALHDTDLVNLQSTSGILIEAPSWKRTYWLQVGWKQSTRVRQNQDVRGDYAVTITQVSQCTDDRSLISHYHLIQSDNHIENSVRDGLCEITVGEEERWKAVASPNRIWRGAGYVHYVYLESNANYIITADASINTDSQERVMAVVLYDGYGNYLGRRDRLNEGGRLDDVEMIEYHTGTIPQGAPPFMIETYLRLHRKTDWVAYGDYTVVITKEE